MLARCQHVAIRLRIKTQAHGVVMLIKLLMTAGVLVLYATVMTGLYLWYTKPKA